MCSVAKDIALVKKLVEGEVACLRGQLAELTTTSDLGIITGEVDSISGRNFVVTNRSGKFWHQLSDENFVLRLDLWKGQRVKVWSVPTSVFSQTKKTYTVSFQVTRLEKL